MQAEILFFQTSPEINPDQLPQTKNPGYVRVWDYDRMPPPLDSLCTPPHPPTPRILKWHPHYPCGYTF